MRSGWHTLRVMKGDDAAVEALRALIRIPTVSDWDPAREDRSTFEAILAELRERFPRLHAACDVERIAGDALLVRWPGRTREAPVVLMAHLDVVPVGDASAWTHPPFAGDLADGHVWGRGALDCKGSLVATCQAVEDLIEDGVVPGRDVWLSFGCNEEVSGRAAQDAVAVLRERGVEPWFVLDEGGAIVQGALPGVDAPMAVVGVSEKGTVDVELIARGDGGHASAPRRMGPTSRLARAILRLERRPFPSHLPDATVDMLERDACAPCSPGSCRGSATRPPPWHGRPSPSPSSRARRGRTSSPRRHAPTSTCASWSERPSTARSSESEAPSRTLTSRWCWSAETNRARCRRRTTRHTPSSSRR